MLLHDDLEKNDPKKCEILTRVIKLRLYLWCSKD